MQLRHRGQQQLHLIPPVRPQDPLGGRRVRCKLASCPRARSGGALLLLGVEVGGGGGQGTLRPAAGRRRQRAAREPLRLPRGERLRACGGPGRRLPGLRLRRRQRRDVPLQRDDLEVEHELELLEHGPERLVPWRLALLQRVVHPDLPQQRHGQPVVQQVHQHRVAGALGVLLGAQARCVRHAPELQASNRLLRMQQHRYGKGQEGPTPSMHGRPPMPSRTQEHAILFPLAPTPPFFSPSHLGHLPAPPG